MLPQLQVDKVDVSPYPTERVRMLIVGKVRRCARFWSAISLRARSLEPPSTFCLLGLEMSPSRAHSRACPEVLCRGLQDRSRYVQLVLNSASCRKFTRLEPLIHQRHSDTRPPLLRVTI